jgi:hypothetical protein
MVTVKAQEHSAAVVEFMWEDGWFSWNHIDPAMYRAIRNFNIIPESFPMNHFQMKTMTAGSSRSESLSSATLYGLMWYHFWCLPFMMQDTRSNVEASKLRCSAEEA